MEIGSIVLFRGVVVWHLDSLTCMRRLRSHINRWQQADQDNGVQNKEQRVACLEVKGGHHHHNDAPLTAPDLSAGRDPGLAKALQLL
jgi:hypothetical protein